MRCSLVCLHPYERRFSNLTSIASSLFHVHGTCYELIPNYILDLLVSFVVFDHQVYVACVILRD